MVLLVFLKLHQYGQKVAQFVRLIGMRGGERFDVDRFTTTECGEKLLHQSLCRNGPGHALNSE